MFGFFRAIFVTLLILLLCLFVGVWTWRVPIVSKVLTYALKTKVTIDELDLSINLSRLTIKNLKIRNPANSNLTSALQIGMIEISTPIYEFLKKDINIQSILLDRIAFNVEMYNSSGSDNNWSRIIERSEPKEVQKKPTPGQERLLSIDLFTLQDLDFSYSHPLTANQTQYLKRIDKIVIRNIGKNHPLTAAQVLAILERTLLNQFSISSGYSAVMKALPALSESYTRGAIIELGGQIKNLNDTFKSTFDFFKSSPKKFGYAKRLFRFMFPEKNDSPPLNHLPINEN